MKIQTLYKYSVLNVGDLFMCDPVSIHNDIVNQNNHQQFIQQNLDWQNQLIQQQQLINMSNNSQKFRPIKFSPLKLSDSIKSAFGKKVNPEKDTVALTMKKEEKIPGINAPGIHRDSDGKIDGIIPGITDNGDFVHVSPADDRIGGRTPDGMMWDGRKVKGPKNPIPGINVPGIHRGSDGKVDGIIPGITPDGDFVHVSPADNRIGGRTPDGKMWDGVRI